LGITSLTNVDVADLVFFRGTIDANTKQLIESLLVDSLLQSGEWNVGVGTHQHVVETALHPGVTDSTTDELIRISQRMDLPIDGVARSKRQCTLRRNNRYECTETGSINDKHSKHA